MFERPERGESVVLVSLNFGDSGEFDYAESLNELNLLASSAGLRVAGLVEGKRSKPDARLFAGSGKAEEIGVVAREAGASLVIFNHELSPVQERNLERLLQCRVLDRTALILDIFALRARSNEGKLQVELAQLRHYSTRLVRGWTHLERQKGGIGMRGGPGESQLELDRRMLLNKINTIEGKLDKLTRSRAIQRRGRQRGGVLSVSLVGYTNAGKSTLFNTLTRADAYAADQLFATLDTTSRKLWLPEAGQQVVLSDTVGFITRLPHTLVAAFEATLEETAHADLLIHVVDSASPNRDRQMEEVEKVLKEIGAEHVPQIRVMNKVDLTDAVPQVARDDCGKITAVWLSAKTGDGVALLREVLADFARDQRYSTHLLATQDVELSQNYVETYQNGLE
jgi:GTP-binding protein HflX